MKLGNGSLILANEATLETSRKGVYAGGDVVLGPASIVEAVAQGRRAASAIDKYLGGNGDISEVLTENRHFNPCMGKDVEFQDKPRLHMACILVSSRVGNFSEVELGFDEKTAIYEAKRCFQCAFRREVVQAPSPW